METMEIAKTVLSRMLEAAEEVTEGQAAAEVVKYGIDYYTALNSLRSVYRELGMERTPEHTGAVICYHKPKREPQLQETEAVRMAKKAAQSNISERRSAAIISNYRR